MSNLTRGFSPSQINDDNAEFDLERALTENGLSEAFKGLILEAADTSSAYCEEVERVDIRFPGNEEMLEAALIDAGQASVAREQFKIFINAYKEPLFVTVKDYPMFPVEVAQVIREEFDRVNLDAPDKHWNTIWPTRFAELAKEHLFAEDPIGFWFAVSNDGLHKTGTWQDLFKMYGDDPYEVLLDELEAQGLEGPLSIAPWLWTGWNFMNSREIPREEYDFRLQITIEWHGRLLDMGLPVMAEQVESDIWTRPITEYNEMYHLAASRMKWMRLLRGEPLKSADEKKELIRLFFETAGLGEKDVLPEGHIDRFVQYALDVATWNQDAPAIESLGHRGIASSPIILFNELPYALILSPFRDVALREISELLRRSDAPEQLRILKHLGDHQYDVDYGKEAMASWNDILRNTGDEFLKGKVRLEFDEVLDWINLSYPTRERQDLVPFADKALVFLRGEMAHSDAMNSVERVQRAYSLLLTYAPDKLLTNLLPAFRKSLKPCCGEALEFGAGDSLVSATVYDHPPHWWISIMISNCLRVQHAWAFWLNGEQKTETTHSLRVTFADYCLKSLKLRKGEKSSKGERYNEDQCVEPSRFWREGFIQALTAIGMDLGGRVHKTLNFVREHDPDEDVRKTAEQAYKSIRHNKNLDSDDPVKGLLVAFWWLRLAQRLDMGEIVTPPAATKTRRNELRYATQTREVEALLLR